MSALLAFIAFAAVGLVMMHISYHFETKRLQKNTQTTNNLYRKDDEEMSSERFENGTTKAPSIRAASGKAVIAILAVITFVIVAATSITIVPTGYTGVKTSFGQIQTEPIPSGKLNFSIPFIQSIKKVNNKQQDKNIAAQIWGETDDKTPVYASDITVTYKIASDKSVYLVSAVSNLDNLVGESLVASSIKSAMAELSPTDVTVRSKIEPLAKEKIQASIDEKYSADTITVVKVVINDMDFQDAYNEAIQKKSIAQQTAATQKIENQTAIDKAEADKQAAITKAEAEAEKVRIAAEAEAEANRKLSESLSDTLVEYKKIEKWDGKLPTVTGGNSIVTLDSSDVTEDAE